MKIQFYQFREIFALFLENISTVFECILQLFLESESIKDSRCITRCRLMCQVTSNYWSKWYFDPRQTRAPSSGYLWIIRSVERCTTSLPVTEIKPHPRNKSSRGIRFSISYAHVTIKHCSHFDTQIWKLNEESNSV